nr:protein ALP1-like isoform X2 [Bactrocera oleae]
MRKIIYETCAAIWNELHTVYVVQPNQSELKNISESYYIKTGMPHCLGGIDGKHINIVCPRRSGSLFYNSKKTFNIVLMTACDSDHTFTFVDVGAVESQSYGGIFAKSAFGKMILRENIVLPPLDHLPSTNKDFQFFFVGGSAFPLKGNLMRPYPGRNLSPLKEHHNKNLSSARVYIENAFGILANRWRILHSNIHAAPKNIDKIVLATVVLLIISC